MTRTVVLTVNKVCRHRKEVCLQCMHITETDAAKRMANIINGYVTFVHPWELKSKWVAIKLVDGGSDGVLYDSREDAIRHQSDERFYAFVCMGAMMSGAKPYDCAIYLEFHREAYDANMRLHEPQAPQLIMPTGTYDRFTGRVRGKG